MTVKTEYVLQGKTARAEPADEAFARFFTTHYREIADRHPVYDELLEYAKMVSLAKYLKAEGVPLLWFLMANKDRVLTEDSPGTVDALVRGSSHWKGITIEGGVDLGAEGQYVIDTRAARAIEDALARSQSAVPTAGGGTRAAVIPATAFTFDAGKDTYTVIPQHSLTAGHDRRGIRYQTDVALRGDGGPGLEVVRYFDPARPRGGELGEGWRLLVPYRVRPEGDERRDFVNVRLPLRMGVENLVTGDREVLTFSADRYAAAGWVPDRVEASQVIGLFVLSDASYRLADKLGNEFWFDPAGDLTDMVFADDRRLHVAYEPAPDPSGRVAAPTFLVSALSDGSRTAHFEYEVGASGAWRVAHGRVTREGVATPRLELTYEYDAGNRLARVVRIPEPTGGDRLRAAASSSPASPGSPRS